VAPASGLYCTVNDNGSPSASDADQLKSKVWAAALMTRELSVSAGGLGLANLSAKTRLLLVTS
jgi:hypothetical protein